MNFSTCFDVKLPSEGIQNLHSNLYHSVKNKTLKGK